MYHLFYRVVRRRNLHFLIGENSMSKPTSFSEIMKNPHKEKEDQVWISVMDSAKVFEQEKGYSRRIICQALIKAAMDLAQRHEDERYFQKTSDVRYFYLWAMEYTKRKFDTYIGYKMQRFEDERFGKDALSIRDAKLYGWNSDPDSEH